MHVYRTLAAVFALLIVVLATSALAFAHGAQAQEDVTIDVGDFWYCDASFEEGTCETTIGAGDTVVWDFSSGINSHTVTECGASCDDPTSSPLFDSGNVAPAGTYSHTFDDPGTLLYFCDVHPTLMFGRIVVQAAQPEPATRTPSSVEPGDVIPPGSTPPGGLPTSGDGPDGAATASWWPAIVVLVGGGALLLLLGVAGYRRTTRS